MLDDDFDAWRWVIETGADSSLTSWQAAERTVGRHLHCVELWMPGNCNLRCRHCYVASTRRDSILAERDYRALTLRAIADGLIDVVVPGMEPLLRRELWTVLEAARDARVRSVGITTNGTLLSKHASRLHDSSLTVLNVSVDGPPTVHDRIRGDGVFEQLERGVHAFREISHKRVLTNTTVHAENVSSLKTIASWSLECGVDYSAFHPFEMADEAENSLALTPEAATDGYRRLFDAFGQGNTSSIVLEAEPSTSWVVVRLAQSGALDHSQLVMDEAGLLFLREESGDRELLVGLNFYPHHFIRTVRLVDDGGLSSCRSMARTGWRGLGDSRRHSIHEIARSAHAIEALAMIWGEFRDALKCLNPDAVQWFINFLRSKVGLMPRMPVPRVLVPT